MTFIPSEQQSNFFNWITTGKGSCVLEAVAGAGKTTTLIEALKLMEGDIFFGSYNKKIADEIKSKAPNKTGLNIGTMHSAGFGIWRRVAGNVKVDNFKCRNIYRSMFTEYEDRKFETVTVNLVSYAKQAAIGAVVPNEDTAWYNLIEHFNIDCMDNDELILNRAKKVFTKSVAQDTDVIDFDDMILAPLIHHAKAYEHDWVLIDEAQDTNASRRALALLMLKRGGRLVAVGDRHQAIYGFTGADSDALDLIGNAVDAIQMPLTVTYRCPSSIVTYANQFVKHIVAHPSSPVGKVEVLKTNITETAKEGDAILCRFTRPIISLVYQFIAKGIPAKVEGREIGTSIKTLVRRYKCKNFSVLIDRLDTYRDRESAKYRIKEKESQAIAIEDKVACIKVIIKRVQEINPKCTTPIDSVCEEIDNIFGDDLKGCVILSTIHKSKGREWNNVFWLQSAENKWARMDWEKVQEINLKYVACTRAKQNLFLVHNTEETPSKVEIEVYENATTDLIREVLGGSDPDAFKYLPEDGCLNFNPAKPAKRKYTKRK